MPEAVKSVLLYSIKHDMKFGICNLSLVAVRKSPDHCSEIVTQLLFGDTFEIIEKENAWINIKTHYDEYFGWIHHLQFQSLDISEFEVYNAQLKVLVSDSFSFLTDVRSKMQINLLMGSCIPLPASEKFSIGSSDYRFKGNYISAIKNKTSIIQYAEKFLNAPYLWGGRTLYGIDCSGFTQMVYKMSGFFLPRDASQQAQFGETLSFLSEAETGDLVFFDNELGNITHVGIVYDNQHIIHSSGCVRIDLLDHNGIFNAALGKYTHSLRLIKKLL